MSGTAMTRPEAVALSPPRGTSDPALVANGDRGFGLYVHWPFCKAKCPYCDFNSHVRAAVDHARWQAALVRELDHMAADTGGRRLTSIFFGGGTPSLMAPQTVAAVIDRAVHRWSAADSLEITLEANPTSFEAGAFAGFRAAGVNRVSLGVQALDDGDLAFLGRQHSAAEALYAVRQARERFDRVSFDLIYARPNQTVASWAKELLAALAEGPDHLSVYQLTVEEGTQFHTLWQRGALPTLDEGRQADLYEATQQILEEAGLPAYEVSNHATPGQASRHNLVYWRYGDYAGIGPGAHGRLTLDGAKWATRTHRAPEVWLSMVERAGSAEHQRVLVERADRMAEALMMGLRLTEGVPVTRLSGEAGRDWRDGIHPERIDAAIGEGYLRWAHDPARLVATPSGRLRLNALIGHLLH